LYLHATQMQRNYNSYRFKTSSISYDSMIPVRHSGRYSSTKFEKLRYILGSCGSLRVCE